MDNFASPNVRTVPGGFWRRFVAMMIDGFIVTIVQFPLSLAIGAATHVAKANAGESARYVVLGMNALSILLSLVVTFIYWGWFYHNKGASPGKMLLGLRVVTDDTGTNLTYWKAFWRETIGKMISALPLLLGFIWAAFRPDKKTFHDLILKTQVLRKE